MIDIWTLRVLVEVAEHGSFSAAGEALSMTQPAVSRQIAGLERRVGVPLFRRVARGVRPTAAGTSAVVLARDVLARMHALEAQLSTFTGLDAGHLRMSAFPSTNTSLTPEAIRRFSDAHPGIEVSLVQTDPAGAIAAVRAGRVDLALVTAWELYADPGVAKHDLSAPPLPAAALDGVDLVPLLDEELHVALPTDHRLASRARVPLRELRDERWIEGAHPDCLGPIPRLAEALGASPRIGFFCDDWNGKLALVAAHAGVTLVPTSAHPAVRRDVALRPTAPALPTRRLYAAVPAPPFRPPAATAMVDVLTTWAGRAA